jgi:hypothetical protein
MPVAVGVTVSLPLVVLSALPLSVHDVALVLDHVSVAELPSVIDVGLTETVAVGTAAAVTVNVAEAVAVPPAPVQERLYTSLPVAVGVTVSLPLVVLSALPFSVHDVALVLDHVTVAELPSGIDVGLTETVAVGAAEVVTVKSLAEKPQFVPLPKAICWAPVAASAGTVILTWVLLTLVIPASWAEPSHAAVIPDRPVPVMVISVPTGPDAGVNELMLGEPEAAAVTVSVAEAVAVPPAPVQERLYTSLPVAVGVTVSLPLVELSALPFSVHDVALVLDHVTVAELPSVIDVGLTETVAVGFGAAVTVKSVEEKPQFVPLPRAICWAPVAASAGTVILTCVLLTLVIPASWAEPSHAAVMLDRPVPVMVIIVPTGPDAGVNELMLGEPEAAVTVSVAEAVAVPPAPVQERLYTSLPVAVGVTVSLPLVVLSALPLSVHDVALVLDHVTVAELPSGIDVGLTETVAVGFGAAVTVKSVEEKPQFVPLPTAICWVPMAASAGTVILTCVLLTLVIPASWAEPSHAAVMPDRPVPVIVISVPTGPDVGVNEVIEGCEAAAPVTGETSNPTATTMAPTQDFLSDFINASGYGFINYPFVSLGGSFLTACVIRLPAVCRTILRLDAAAGLLECLGCYQS